MEGQLRESPASHPTQQQLSLGISYILEFYIKYHLTEGSFCSAGKKSLRNTSLIPFTPPHPFFFLTIEETGGWKTEVSIHVLTPSYLFIEPGWRLWMSQVSSPSQACGSSVQSSALTRGHLWKFCHCKEDRGGTHCLFLLGCKHPPLTPNQL